ncbi:DegT/DnrJ/EryC1/StrS family aminotransferase [Streptomyces sp. NBC_00316]|uniref:DegT/DnrJ/EryC1/StrS family aminotransferase n=1 Tax=Streptomyces sp. NBC_00316 TaxID=2975710 RepID=UPI002E29258C|nr:DegT/DnrJ/EryC1/StrS family aminotransferase [Streptomyces sp. NBC_00316]
MEQAGIGTSIHYPIPLHRSPAYATAVNLPHSDDVADQVLSLPVRPHSTAAGRQACLCEQDLGLSPVASRLAQPRRLLLAAVLARQHLPDRVGGRRGLTLALRPGLGFRAGGCAGGDSVLRSTPPIP